MLKVKRPPLSPILQKRLSKYQRQINIEGRKAATIWKNFRDADSKQDQKQQPTYSESYLNPKNNVKTY